MLSRLPFFFIAFSALSCCVWAYQEAKEEELSPCLHDCLQPIAKQDKSFTYVFNNYEKVCDRLERGAECVRKCGNEDASRFYHFTSFYRLYCIDFQEGIEEHLSCLAKASQGSDKECKRRCHIKYEKMSEKEKKMKHACSSIECTTVCYYQLLSEECPNSQQILLNVNLAQISQLNASIDPKRKDRLSDECHHLYDKEYMRRKLLDRR